MAEGAVLHVITGLNMGGAEAMLAKLLSHPMLRAVGQSHEVLSLLTPGRIAARISAAEVPVHSLHMGRRLPGPAAVLRLRSVVRRLKPQVIQGWMYHGNLAGVAACAFSHGSPPLIWNIRHSVADIDSEPIGSRRIIRGGARLSGRAVSIIYNSEAAASQHEGLGYCRDRRVIIGNGFDCQRYAPDQNARARLRRLFGIRTNAVVVAMVARAHPMKSIHTLVEAVLKAQAAGDDVHLLLVGRGMDRPQGPLAALLAQVPADRLSLEGEREDVPDWLPGVDILALPSAWGEGFPNILGEAMACGVPCVATDVGDSRRIVGNTGLIVPARDPDALANAISRMVRAGQQGRQLLGQAARVRATENFSLDGVVAQYAALYAPFLQQAHPAAAAAPGHVIRASS